MQDFKDDSSSAPAPGQPPHVLEAWIRDLLAEIAATRAKRLDELSLALRGDDFEWDGAPLAQALSAMNAAGRELRFGPLRPGWLARLMGRHRAARARFIAACERFRGCALHVKAEARALAHGRDALGSRAKRALVEIELECRSLNADIDEGVTWLQDMCTQLAGAREAGNDDPQLDAQAQAAQLFTQEFKRLQGASTMAHEISIRGADVLQRRGAILAQVRSDMERFDKTWVPRLARLVEELEAGRAPVQAIAKGIEAHDELMKGLAASADACGALQLEDELFAQQLAVLHREIAGRAS